MDAREDEGVGIESLPDYILHLIVCKIASSSAVDFCHVRGTCKSLNFNVRDTKISADLNLNAWVKNPKKALHYIPMIDFCLMAGNLDAHFVKGVIEFFNNKNKYLGLHHLQIASRGGHSEGSYLFGVMLMCLGSIEKGKKVINNLANSKGMGVVQKCWKTTHEAVCQFTLYMKEVYIKSYTKMKPATQCHPNENNTVCSECFHFFLVSEFFEMVLKLDKIWGDDFGF